MAFRWDSLTNPNTSPLTNSRNYIKKIRLKSSEPGILSLGLHHSNSLIYSYENKISKDSFSSKVNWLKTTISKIGLTRNWSLKKISKWLLISLFTSETSSSLPPLVTKHTNLFLRNLYFNSLWKNLELESPSLSHLWLDFCLQMLSLKCMTSHTMFKPKNLFHANISWSIRVPLSIIMSKSLRSMIILPTSKLRMPKISLFQILNFYFRWFNFSIST